MNIPSKADLSEFDFLIVFPQLGKAELPRLGRFVRQDRGELLGVHVYFDSLGRCRFTQDEFERVYSGVLEEFIRAVRPVRRNLPLPMPLILKRIESKPEKTEKPATPKPKKTPKPEPIAAVPQAKAKPELVTAGSSAADDDIPTIPMPQPKHQRRVAGQK